MATIADAVASRALELFELPSWETRRSIRPLWVSPVFWDWTDGTEALWDKRLGSGGRVIFEHLEQVFCDFRCSERFPAGDLRRMMPNKAGIWSMHSLRLRTYGWSPAPRQFVAVCGALEGDTKSDKSLNDRKRDEVLHFIRSNDLENTILAGDINDLFPT